MGSHICRYCDKNQQNKFPNTSSSEFFLPFSTGRIYKIPEMLLHYVVDHMYQPGEVFISDVMNATIMDLDDFGATFPDKKSKYPKKDGLTKEEFKQKRSAWAKSPIFGEEKVGYLEGPFQKGDVPENFAKRLEGAMKESFELNGKVMSFGG